MRWQPSGMIMRITLGYEAKSYSVRLRSRSERAQTLHAWKDLVKLHKDFLQNSTRCLTHNLDVKSVL